MNVLCQAQNGAIGQAQLSPEEVTRRLRLLKQPVKLFAEVRLPVFLLSSLQERAFWGRGPALVKS